MVPSLENMCGVPVVVVLANHPDVKKQIFSSSTIKLYKNYDEQKRWENAINEQTSEILKDYNPVLKSIFPRLRVKFIGIEMLKWTENLQKYFDLSLKFTQDFIKTSFFTSKGIIDEDKAARELVKEQSLNLLSRYKVACHFYLQDVVTSLWQELRINEPNFDKILGELGSETPMVIWANYLEERNSNVQNLPPITSKFKGKIFYYGINKKNVAALKFSLDPEGEFKESKGKSKREKTLLTTFRDCVEYTIDFNPINPSLDALLSKKIVASYNFIEYVISTMNVKKYLLKYDLAYSALDFFFYWPHQYQFMKIVPICFETMDEEEYHSHLGDIISFIHEENLNSSFNYRLLLREFWIKSPTLLKKYVIDGESGEHLANPNETRDSYDLLLIERLFRIRQFTSDDIQNVYLIVKEASTVNKENILQIQGKNVCGHLCSFGNYKLANFFFKVLDLKEDTVKTFKKDFAFDIFLSIIKTKSKECVSDEFFKWILGTDEIDELKKEIFYTLTHTNKIENLFEFSEAENRFSFLDKILKLFLKTDDKIEDWNKNISLNMDTPYSPLIQYNNPDWFDSLLMYLGTSVDKISDIKRDLLLRNVPKIAKSIFEKVFKRNILFLCLYKKERLRNFTQNLRAFYRDSITQKMCLLCMDNNLVSINEDDGQLQCEHHRTSGFISFSNVNVMCTYFSKHIDKVLRRQIKRKGDIIAPFLEIVKIN